MQRTSLFLLTTTLLLAGSSSAQSDDCTSPEPIAGTGTFNYDTTGFVTSGLSMGGWPCVTSIQQDGFFTWTAPSSGNFHFAWCGSTYDTRAQIHLGSDCNATCVTQNDDSCYLQTELDLTGVVAGQQYVIQVGGYGFGDAGPASFTVGIGGTSPGIQVMCDPANPHHLGGSAHMNFSTLGASTQSGLHIEVMDGPPGEFGFLLVSSVTMSPAIIFNGFLCLGPTQGRYNPQAAANTGLPALNSLAQFDANGVLQNIAGTAPSTGGSGFDVPSTLPLPGTPSITPGSVWYFQAWFRDQQQVPGDSANFSNVIEVTFP